MAQEGPLSAELDMLSHVLRLVEAFRAFDADSDGQISAAELGGIMGSLGYNPAEADIQAMMQKGDTNKDGLLSITEFLDLNTKDLGLGGLSTILRRVFAALDFQGEEFVTGEELFEVVENMGQDLSLQDCQSIIASVDGDGDGAISYEDFKLIVKALL
ncbi:probable calcium-binding protein CML29 [Coffea eugenioides]|uniref:probable calcium-binding protein CML29 n=1 Tax=Coffea eugenioides TaxID=49369 RepID=UPI000F60F7E6|nr:probable calcium-binding protein CML29 [Coffea eugenioides]